MEPSYHRKIVLNVNDRPEVEGLREIETMWSGVFKTPTPYGLIMFYIDIQMGRLVNPFLLSVIFKKCNEECVIY